MARKGKIKVKKSAQLRKKNEQPKGRIMPTKTILTDNGATFKVKIRKKN